MIKDYIKSKELAWASSTLKSEKARLSSIADWINGDPEALWNAISNQKPYSRVTTWTRVTDYYQWLLDTKQKEGENLFDLFRRKNRRLFKNVYSPKIPTITFEEAKEVLKSIKNPQDRQLALQLLGSGERVSEGYQQSGEIIGKGNKRRTTYRPDASGEIGRRSYSSLSRSLKSVGLRAHDLRKLFASKLVELGFKEADLLKVMGWTNMNTARVYLQPKRDAEIESTIKQIHEGML